MERSKPRWAEEASSIGERAEGEVYCPRCQRPSLRNEWRHVWRYLKNGKLGGSPAEVLKHRVCGELVYVAILDIDDRLVL